MTTLDYILIGLIVVAFGYSYVQKNRTIESLQSELQYWKYAFELYREKDYEIRIKSYRSQGLTVEQIEERLLTERHQTLDALPLMIQDKILAQDKEKARKRDEDAEIWAWIDSLKEK